MDRKVNKNIFGSYFKKLRLEANFSLRKFCRKAEVDPSNWSKIERGRLNPPTDEEKLKKVANSIGIKCGSDEWDELESRANIAQGQIPGYIMDDEEVLELMPAFFRSLGSMKPTKEDIVNMIEIIKREY